MKPAMAPAGAGENLYDVWEQGLEALHARGVSMLPRTLEEALDAFDSDPLSESTFGPDMKAAFLKHKRQEWADYTKAAQDDAAEVTAWERARYLRMF